MKPRSSDWVCKNCDHSELMNCTDPYYECRYNPPVVLAGENFTETRWPEVSPDNWCSKWESSSEEN